MDFESFTLLMGGLGMFLLGIHHLTEGLKGFAGDALRHALQKLVSGNWSGILSGAVFTALVQSSSAAILTVIGFVSAGLVTFPQAIAVVLGANLGTTATSWLVAVFGFKVKISAAALPMLGLGAFLWLLAKGRVRAVGAVLAGFGLVFSGIEYLQTGMATVEWKLDGIGNGASAPWILAGIGVLMTIVMQSSSAAGATTLVALAAGTLTLDQAFAMVVGQNVGTTATALLASVGGSLAVKRTVLAHILFNLTLGVLAMGFLGHLGAVARWLGDLMDDEDGVLTLAAFHTIFNGVGVVLFFPWIRFFAKGIEWLTGRGKVSAVSRLDVTVAKAGGPVAMEAAWLALMETGEGVLKRLKAMVSGDEFEKRDLRTELESIAGFVESLRFEGTDSIAFAGRRVRVWHALDHLRNLVEDLETRPVSALSKADEATVMGCDAITQWLTAAGASAVGDGDPVAKMEQAAKAIAVERKEKRAELLEKVALGQIKTAEANRELVRLRWTDGAFYHAWRMVNALRDASGKKPEPPTPADDGPESA